MNIDPSRAIDTIERIINGFFALLPKIAIAIIVLFLFVLVARGVNRLVQRALRAKRHRNLALVLGRLVEWAIILSGIFAALIIVIPSLTAANFVQLLGIGGVAIGFAFRDILQNFLAGILLLLTEPFDLGDQIVVGDFEGTVEDIETRATMIKTYDGRRVVIPNADLFTQSVTVNTAYETRRIAADLYITAASDVVEAKRLMLEAMRGVEEVLDDPSPQALAIGFVSAGVQLRARWWIKPPRQTDIYGSQDQVVTAIRNALTQGGIELYNPNA